ncbi:MAG: hypothetical protein AAFR61_30530 [Bacteroidota bacterium]
MAKKFLDRIGEAFDDSALEEVIPVRKQTPTPTPRRKKSFLDSVNQQQNRTSPTPKRKPTRKSSPRRKSFLETIEDALDSDAFDDIIPPNGQWKRKDREKVPSRKELDLDETRFSTMITTEVLQRAREIAELKGIRIKDVINKALKIYIEKEHGN